MATWAKKTTTKAKAKCQRAKYLVNTRVLSQAHPKMKLLWLKVISLLEKGALKTKKNLRNL